MRAYAGGVFLLSFLVNILLLIGASRLCGYSVRPLRLVVAGTLGSLHGSACLLPGFAFLGNVFWRVVSLGGMAVVAYGLSFSALRRGLAFAVLSLALGTVASSAGREGVAGILPIAGVLCLLCFLGCRRGARYIPVELVYGQRQLHLTALRDTGNTLRDPVTGQQVLVVGADAAERLTGLSRAQLRTPVESVQALPGLRLIPCHTVNGHGFLLALRLHNVKIGAWRGSTVVAFAPEQFSPDGTYQALTGGEL